jgi:FkbM family methyltransferase
MTKISLDEPTHSRFVYPHLKRVVRLLKMVSQSQFGLRTYEFRRLRRLPRYVPTSTKLQGKPLHLVDGKSFVSAYKEIFDRQIYRFSSSRKDPLILDCGANIGLAVLYWKKLFPEARIIAFEPDPNVFQALSWNCAHWNITGVELVNKAVWKETGELSFWSEGADAGHIVDEAHGDKNSRIKVPAVRLKDYLRDPIDFLKIDIEGAETEVLIDCADRLNQVGYLFVEYHDFIGQQQRLDEVLRVLRSSDFRVYIRHALVSPTPFSKRIDYRGMDHSLNIFAYREMTRNTRV